MAPGFYMLSNGVFSLRDNHKNSMILKLGFLKGLYCKKCVNASVLRIHCLF